MAEHTPNQADVTRVWRSEWSGKQPTEYQIFTHRLFLEGYAVFKNLIPVTAKKILETGTGSGRYGVALARDFPDASIVATDITEESLVAAQTLADAVRVNNFKTKLENVEALSFESDSFDVVLSDVVIQHVADDVQAVKEMARVLRPGGLLILTAVNARSVHAFVKVLQKMFGRTYRYEFERMYTRKDLVSLAQQSGLDVVVTDGFYPAYGIYRLKRFWSGFGLLGKLLNRLTKFLDSFTHRSISKTFGFELVLVAEKPYY